MRRTTSVAITKICIACVHRWTVQAEFPSALGAIQNGLADESPFINHAILR